MLNNKKTFILIVTVVTIFTLLISGCSNSSNNSKQSTNSVNSNKVNTANKDNNNIKIAVVLKALNSDYWRIVAAGAKDAGKELGVDVEVIAPNSEEDISGQVAMIEDQITKNVSALVVSPSLPSAEISVLTNAVNAKIPVLLIDTDIANFDKKETFIGTGNVKAGEMGAEYLSSKLPKGSDVAIIRGDLGNTTMDDREKGAKDAFEKAGMNVVDVQPANSDRNMAYSVMQNMWQTHPNIKAVFALNDEMALGAEKALKQMGKNNVLVIGVDGSPDALLAVKNGELAGTVAQQGYNMGKFGVEDALKVIKGEKIPKIIDTGTVVVTKDNVDDMITKTEKYIGRKIE
ncbi:sugar ABC transporter substrate-binding protein [Thermoanaerobacterium thermosaccharolyticum]|uniref:sugar ABC transporter substrate-binding protein n=1 Tax=Thermoanaerobacterium thermosaccharolyticum TaxID=1517 RepID=UPI003DA83B5E